MSAPPNRKDWEDPQIEALWKGIRTYIERHHKDIDKQIDTLPISLRMALGPQWIMRRVWLGMVEEALKEVKISDFVEAAHMQIKIQQSVARLFEGFERKALGDPHWGEKWGEKIAAHKGPPMLSGKLSLGEALEEGAEQLEKFMDMAGSADPDSDQ